MIALSAGLHAYRFEVTRFAGRLMTRRNMNRLLCEVTEVNIDKHTQEMTVVLKKDDPRTKHIKEVLHLQPGDPIRSAVINMGMTNNATIRNVGDDVEVNLGCGSKFYLGNRPKVDLILALPRPQKLAKLLPIISCLGVRRLYIVGANKVEPAYFGSHLLREKNEIRQLLLEGLAQAEVDCMLPEVHIAKNLRQFVDEELSSKSDFGQNIRIIAHPPIKEYNENRLENTQAPRPMRDRGGENNLLSYQNVNTPLEKVGYVSSLQSLRISDYLNSIIPTLPSNPVEPSSTCTVHSEEKSDERGITIAIGPEGGWLDEEVRLLQHQGFQLVNLGPRVLRTDIA
eukprot:gene21968-24906_t